MSGVFNRSEMNPCPAQWRGRNSKGFRYGICALIITIFGAVFDCGALLLGRTAAICGIFPTKKYSFSSSKKKSCINCFLGSSLCGTPGPRATVITVLAILIWLPSSFASQNEKIVGLTQPPSNAHLLPQLPADSMVDTPLPSRKLLVYNGVTDEDHSPRLEKIYQEESGVEQLTRSMTQNLHSSD